MKRKKRKLIPEHYSVLTQCPLCGYSSTVRRAGVVCLSNPKPSDIFNTTNLCQGILVKDASVAQR